MELKPIPKLAQAHLDHGLPLLADLNLPLLFSALQRAFPTPPKDSPKPASQEGAPKPDPASQDATPKPGLNLSVAVVQDLVQALKGIGERRALRRLTLVATSSGEELFEFENNPTAEAAALKRIALGNPLDGFLAVLGFLRASGLFTMLSPGSSAASGESAKDSEAGPETLASSSGTPSGD